MDYNLKTKEMLLTDCKDEFMRMVRALTRSRYTPSGEHIKGMSQMEIASICHLTISQMSRVATGVCCPSAPVFYVVQKLYNSKLMAL